MFKDYESKPVIRRAFQIESSHTLERQGTSDTWKLTGKNWLLFHAAETPQIGGWVIYLDDTDVYYCNDKVFRERNIVPE